MGLKMFVRNEASLLFCLWPLLVLLVLSGCSDAGSGASLPTIAYSSPAQDSSQVSILSSVTVTLSKAVDPDSVNSATVVLTGDEGTVTGSVSYDEATHTITFTPWSLDYGQTYTLTLTGVTNPMGRVMAVETIRFSTYVNPVDYHVTYRRDVDGAIEGYQLQEYDEQGAVLRVSYYNDAGADGLWQTADDQRSGVTLYEYEDNADGNLVTRSLYFVASGVDGVWLTDDDTFVAAEERWSEEHDQATRRFSVDYLDGGDGLWQSADDAIIRYDREDRTTVTTDAGEQVDVQSTRYIAEGADGRWLTDDDVIDRYSRNVMTESAAEASGYSIYYIGPGDDGEWLTADDEATSYQSYTTDAESMRVIRYGSAGDDGQWMTADDVVAEYYDSEIIQLASDKTLLTAIYYDAAGVDGEWFTADDEVKEFFSFQFEEEFGRATSIRYADVGGDGLPFTADDVIDSVAIGTTLQDENGVVELDIDYDGPGPDGVWLTDDDNVSRYARQVVDADGNRVSELISVDSGPDGEWLTGDDLYSRVIEYDTTY